MKKFLLAIDEGTTSTRAMIFNDRAQVAAVSQKAFRQYFPKDGWVEHDPVEIWQETVSVCRDALFRAKLKASDIAAIGITNQRETSIIWDKKTGEPIYNAIVWQDRRGAPWCEQLKAQGHQDRVHQKTGLLLDAYFCASKIAWLLDHVKDARRRAENGELAFGTIDSFLLWQLTGGKVHATDITNASRTLMFNIHEKRWDDELLALFNIPKSILPEVKASSADFGKSATELFHGEILIGGIAGDQQAATIGQACFTPGMAKCTYGTGAFLMLNTGAKVIDSSHQLLSTVAYEVGDATCYAMEGSIFIAGAVMQWLRDNIHFFGDSRESEHLARQVTTTGGVYFVPAFTGLGAPFWNPHVRGAILGLTRDSNIAHITRAALEAVCYQTRDLLEAMRADGAANYQTLRVDGGMVKNDWLCQFLADILDIPVVRPKLTETTALGAAFLAGIEAGFWRQLNDISTLWQADETFEPKMSAAGRERLYSGWLEAVNLLLRK